MVMFAGPCAWVWTRWLNKAFIYDLSVMAQWLPSGYYMAQWLPSGYYMAQWLPCGYNMAQRLPCGYSMAQRLPTYLTSF